MYHFNSHETSTISLIIKSVQGVHIFSFSLLDMHEYLLVNCEPNRIKQTIYEMDCIKQFIYHYMLHKT